MNDAEVLQSLRDAMQEDVGFRGLRRDPHDNLIDSLPGDFANACREIAETTVPRLAIITGFTIPGTQPPMSETDGPLGALFLARALAPLGIHVAIASDGSCLPALEAGLEMCGLSQAVTLAELPEMAEAYEGTIRERFHTLRPRYLLEFTAAVGSFTHLIALERVGPGHTHESIHSQGESAAWQLFPEETPEAMRGRCRSMRGRDITDLTRPAHLLFEAPPGAMVGGFSTVGIGDGGNEIGMGKLAWETIRRNIPQGGLIACRVPTDHAIVAGISNWGAYALAAGVRWLRRAPHDPALYSSEREHAILRKMVDAGPLVDGVTGERTATVDGLTFSSYGRVLERIGKIAAGPAA